MRLCIRCYFDEILFHSGGLCCFFCFITPFLRTIMSWLHHYFLGRKIGLTFLVHQLPLVGKDSVYEY